jgi:hypothetical protein
VHVGTSPRDAAGLGEHGVEGVRIDPGDALPGAVGAATLAPMVAEHALTWCCSLELRTRGAAARL